MLLPGAKGRVLTKAQRIVFRRSFCFDTAAPDFSGLDPMPVQHDTEYPVPIMEKHETLCKLFGELQEPGDAVAVGGSTPGPASLSDHRSSHASSHHTLSQPAFPNQHNFATPSAPPVQHTPAVNDTGRRVNRFKGRLQPSKKRAHSPGTGGNPTKVARLGAFLTKGDFIEDLQCLKTVMSSDNSVLRSDLREVRTAVQANKVLLGQQTKEVCGIATRLADALQVLQQHEDNLSRLANDVSTHKDEVLRKLASSLTKVTKSLKDHENSFLASQIWTQSLIENMIISAAANNTDRQRQNQELLEKLNAQSVAQEVIKEQVEALRSRVDTQATAQEALQQRISKPPPEAQALEPPQPGQIGYLAQFSPPAQWESDQAAYEQALNCAAWFYIHSLGSVEGGCYEDEST